MTTVTFQAQNPALSHYSLGWASCTAYSAAMVASFDRQVPELCTGAQVRTRTGDMIGGLNLAQVDAALQSGWGVNLDVLYNLPWADFARRIDAGEAAILQGGYGPIANSRFNAGRGFRGNHAIAVMPGWVAMDPLADGLFGNYRYKGEAYPQALLRDFAGQLNIGPHPLGPNHVYAAFSHAVHQTTWRVSLPPSQYGVFTVSGTVVSSVRVATTGGFSAKCGPPRLYQWPGHTSQSLVRVLSGSHAGQYVRRSHAKEV